MENNEREKLIKQLIESYADADADAAKAEGESEIQEGDLVAIARLMQPPLYVYYTVKSVIEICGDKCVVVLDEYLDKVIPIESIHRIVKREHIQEVMREHY